MKTKTSFFCSDCGNESAKWFGRCPACGAWNTLTETERVAPKKTSASSARRMTGPVSQPQPISSLKGEDEIRFPTGMSELDRVLGGGAVRGSLVLVGGAPGIGKSTLLLQICGLLDAGETILYVTGEESQRQLKMRALRLGVNGENLYVLSETNLDEILDAASSLKPDVLIADSIQTLFLDTNTSAPGSVSQVKDCTMALMQFAKAKACTAFIVGHVNKEGAIAGPKVLEHMVDCVLYFEGEHSLSYRILRAAKNRFGSTNEIGVFEMVEYGLKEVPNPSEMLLSGRPEQTPGTCVTCVMEGTRPILAEIQALVTPTNFNVSRRNTNGMDYNRSMLLLAVLEKRGGMAVGNSDTYINVIGGLELDEPAADLAAILAIASSHRDKPIGNDIVAIGEVGLTGEIRSVTNLSQRLTEVQRLGFTRCILPAHVREKITPPKGLTLISVKNIREAIYSVLSA